jgi:hypothetical protein
MAARDPCGFPGMFRFVTDQTKRLVPLAAWIDGAIASEVEGLIPMATRS